MIPSEKFDLLINWLQHHEKVAVAFSGGVDSTFLLAAAKKALGNNVLALSVSTPYIPEWEILEAREFCTINQVEHIVISSGIIPEIMNNPRDRCYLCKLFIFSKLKEEALSRGYSCLVDGSNADDTGVYRPGLAALRELGIGSPLLETGITKAEVRQFSEKLGLPTASKPSYACLLTRLPYNYAIDTTELYRIEKAERFLASEGFAGVRVRNHGDLARIEIEKKDLTAFINASDNGKITRYLHQIGYRYVTVDLDGYRSGSFDNEINQGLS